VTSQVRYYLHIRGLWADDSGNGERDAVIKVPSKIKFEISKREYDKYVAATSIALGPGARPHVEGELAIVCRVPEADA